MGMTRWDITSNSKLPLAHTALGGFPLALFGSGNIYSWPTCLEQVHSCFNNIDKPPIGVFNDSGGRSSWWANCATGIGAIFHELGHSFQLRHTKMFNPVPGCRSFQYPCMGRGFDQFNRIFTLSEMSGPGSSRKEYLFPQDETNLHIHSVIRLLYNPFFASGAIIDEPHPNPEIKRQGNQIIITSKIGIVEVSLYDFKSGDVIFTQPLAVFPPLLYSLSVNCIHNLQGIMGSKFVGCTAMNIYGGISNELISLNTSNISEQTPILDIEPVERRRAIEENSQIRIGSRIRLVHLLTGKYLSSYSTNYCHPNSSTFQQVTCADESKKQDIQCQWIVEALEDRSRRDSCIRTVEGPFALKHVSTGQYLHSHSGIPSPLTNQQEVCCVSFHDYNNQWHVHAKDKTQDIWMENEPVLFSHISTRHYLHSHGGFTSYQFTSSQQEVTCWPHINDDNNFFIAELC